VTDEDRDMSPDDDSAPNPADDAARRLLARARSTARSAPPISSGSSSRGGPRRSRGDNRSGARPDGRDPQTAGDVLDSWLTDAGFTEALTSGGVEAHWETIVGADVAGHVTCEPTQTPEGRVLVLRADSTAWATQVRLLLPMIHRRIQEVLGHAVTDPIRVVGPAPPKRSMGPRRVPGPGPRDTYG
jgi:predicted nucleic acid-binding Zn ribbon protein